MEMSFPIDTRYVSVFHILSYLNIEYVSMSNGRLFYIGASDFKVTHMCGNRDGLRL